MYNDMIYIKFFDEVIDRLIRLKPLNH